MSFLRSQLLNKSISNPVLKTRSYATVSGIFFNSIHIHLISLATHHWLYERGVSIVLVPLITSAFIVGPSPAIDFALGVVIPLHCHMGFETIIADYLPLRRSPVLGRVAHYGLGISTLLALYGFYELNTKDVGITAYTAQLWNGPKVLA